jgi:uncharacterized YccA/Bax inhibitor family protein
VNSRLFNLGFGQMGSPLLAVAGRLRLEQGAQSSVLVFSELLLKLALLLGLVGASAWGWWVLAHLSGAPSHALRGIGLGCGVLAFALAWVASTKPEWSPWLAPAYSLAAGGFVGGMGFALEARFPGIVWESLAVTVAVVAVMGLLYARGWLRATPRFKRAIFAATAGIALVYVVAAVLWLLGWQPRVWAAGSVGEALWLGFVALVAALNLMVDFERIDALRKRRLPAYMTWYTAMGVAVTLVWLYVSVLRLLASVKR